MGNGHGRVIEPKGDQFSGRILDMVSYFVFSCFFFFLVCCKSAEYGSFQAFCGVIGQYAGQFLACSIPHFIFDFEGLKGIES